MQDSNSPLCTLDASWLVNRFAVQAGGITAYEAVSDHIAAPSCPLLRLT